MYWFADNAPLVLRAGENLRGSKGDSIVAARCESKLKKYQLELRQESYRAQREWMLKEIRGIRKLWQPNL